MKMIIASDFHIGAVGRHKQHREDMRKSLEFIVNYAIENDIEVFICGGDGLDRPSRLSNTDLLFLSDIINKLNSKNILTYWAIGNHDLHSKPIMSIYPIQVISKDNITQGHLIPLSDKTELILIPYLCKGDSYPCGKYPKGNKTRIIVVHQLIEGTFPENNVVMRNMRETEKVYSVEEINSLNPDIVFGGHIHIHLEYTLGDIFVYLPSSTTIMTFGEINTEHGFYVYDDNDESIEYISIPQRLWFDVIGLPDSIESNAVYRVQLPKEFKNNFQSIRDEFINHDSEIFLKIEKEYIQRSERISNIIDMTDEDKLKAWLYYSGIEDVTPYLMEHGRILHDS